MRLRGAARPVMLALLAWAGPVQAQSLLDGLTPDTYGRRDEPGVTVASRDRSDYAPLGVNRQAMTTT